MPLAEIIVVLLLVGLGFHCFRICSDRFMLLRHAKSFTPYWWGIGGILSLVLITVAMIGALLLWLGRFH